MKAILVRVGVDQAYGGWNAPVDPDTGDFVYVPIPEKRGTQFHPNCQRLYREYVPVLKKFASSRSLDSHQDLACPHDLLSYSMHLDPDFEYLTYGDVGDQRGAEIKKLGKGDLLVFYAGLRPTKPSSDKLIYALIGVLVVSEIVKASSISEERWHENAHTRKIKRGKSDFVVRGKRGVSGRFTRCIPIGEFRNRAYRVREDLLKIWGDLSVKDGYIQRSARPPAFLNASRFSYWLSCQNVSMVEANNPSAEVDWVVMVHLRQPRKNISDEMRSDPFWELGSFGCTGCHKKNMMHSKRIHELSGVRLAFAQGGSKGFRLVMLTPPVTVVRHADRCELKWTPTEMPFRYHCAPCIIDNNANTDLPAVKKMIRGVDRSTWLTKFSSKFRSSRTPLPEHAARQIIDIYRQARSNTSTDEIASSYIDALPYAPNKIDTTRKKTYKRLIREASDLSEIPMFDPDACHVESSEGDFNTWLWLRPNPKHHNYDARLSYALAIDGYELILKLWGEDAVAGESSHRVDAYIDRTHTDHDFTELRALLFIFQRAIKWGGERGGPVERKLRKNFNRIYGELCNAWLSEALDNIQIIRRTSKKLENFNRKDETKPKKRRSC